MFTIWKVCRVNLFGTSILKAAAAPHLPQLTRQYLPLQSISILCCIHGWKDTFRRNANRPRQSGG
jgi:hypothetical protein